MKSYKLDYNELTLEEKNNELKFNKNFMKFLKFMEIFSIGSSIFFDAEFVKNVYTKSYINHIDYLDNPSSYLYLLFTGLGIAAYIECNYLNEILENENIEIQESIEDGIKIKKISF